MIKVQKQDFDLNQEINGVSQEQTNVGAIVSFTGKVREGSGAQKITSMKLEHYPGMTERELERIEKQARKRWNLIDCLIIHRFGELFPGDNIVLVVTFSNHRTDAFKAAEFLMDYLKTSAPFWKQEIMGDDAHWVEAKKSDEQAAMSWIKPGKESDV